MTIDIRNTILLAGAFLLLFAIGELLYHKLKVKAELSRKFVHILTGFLTMLFPPLIDNHWLVLALCSSFLLILLVSMRFGLLPSINAVNRKTVGSILYPIIVYGCYLIFNHYQNYLFYYIPILILAIADPMAELVGKSLPYGKYKVLGHTKTIMGSTAFFITATITSFVILQLNTEAAYTSTLLIATATGLVTTVAEGLGQKGYDNITIPGSAVVLLYLFIKNTDLLEVIPN